MTATRVATWRTTARLCAMNTIVSDSSSRSCGEQVEDLRLDRDVECADRLVGDDEVGAQRQRTGDSDPLALAAGERVREAVGRIGRQADEPEHLGYALLAGALRSRSRAPAAARR